MIDMQQFTGLINDAMNAVAQELTSVWLLIQLGLIIVAALISALVAKIVRRHVEPVSLTLGWPAVLRLLFRLVLQNVGIIVFTGIVFVAHVVMLTLTWPSRSYFLGVVTSLSTAWLVIAILAGLIRNQFVYRLVAISAWAIAALSILELLAPTMAALDSVGIAVGGLRVTPLLVIKTSVLLLLTLWMASLTGDFLDRRLRTSSDLTPSIQVLVGKVIRLVLIAFAILIALSTVGIDLTALAFFSGAVGVGLGFGLQKIVSNLVSGIILLADKSIKPGDVISLGDSFGWVSNMGARYTSVETRDGREFLIPNEDFVTQRVVNWSFTNNQIRIDQKFGVSYNADPNRVIELAIAAAKATPRVLSTPSPVCHFVNLGDSSIEFLLRFWIKDPVDGLTNVRGKVLLSLWYAFKADGIEIPFPQRDVNFREPVRVEVVEKTKPRTKTSAPAAAGTPAPPVAD